MKIYTLEADGKQYRSKKAEEFAGKLARELRDLTGVDSAYALAKYHSIDTLKEALSYARDGYTVVRK